MTNYQKVNIHLEQSCIFHFILNCLIVPRSIHLDSNNEGNHAWFIKLGISQNIGDKGSYYNIMLNFYKNGAELRHTRKSNGKAQMNQSNSNEINYRTNNNDWESSQV